jgi:hypothetical protein
MKITLIILVVLCFSCTIIEKSNQYPDSMVISYKFYDSIYTHYCDDDYCFWIKKDKFNIRDSVTFNNFGKKYLRVKK